MEQISKKQFRKLCQYAVHYHFVIVICADNQSKTGNIGILTMYSRKAKAEKQNRQICVRFIIGAIRQRAI